MNVMPLRSVRHGDPTRARCGYWAAALALLSAAAVTGRAGTSAAETILRPRVVILVLPGAGLGDLTRAELPHLSSLVRGSKGAWIAAWRPFGLPAGDGLRLRIPLHRDPGRPFGVAAERTALLGRARAALRVTDLLWIDPGDLERAESYAPLCSPGKAWEHRAAALKSADELAHELWNDPEIGDLWLLAPPLQRGPVLAPFFWLHRGGQPGLLRSGSTHMTGVITGEDLAATLAGVVGAAYTGGGCLMTVTPPGVLQRDATAGNSRVPLEALRRLGALAERTDRVRAVVNRLIQWLLLLLIVAGVVALRTNRRLPRPWALASLLLPSLLLLDGARRGGDTPAAVTILLLITAGVAWAGRPPARGHTDRAARPAWRVLAAVTVVGCVVAVLAGDVFRWAILSYSIRLGVRFYGVGNEYMGWWIGAAMLAVGTPAERRVRPGAVGLLIAVALVIGHPSLGGKVGGGITALAAVAVEGWPWLRRHRALAFAALGVAAAALVGLAAWDASRPPDLQTHLGRLALRTLADGPRPFLTLASGKLLTELRVTLGLWGVLLAAGAWLILEARRRIPEAEETRALSRLLPVAAVAFLCNDSGVIAAALMLSYGVLATGSASSIGSRR